MIKPLPGESQIRFGDATRISHHSCPIDLDGTGLYDASMLAASEEYGYG
jgi:hypothetical protein